MKSILLAIGFSAMSASFALAQTCPDLSVCGNLTVGKQASVTTQLAVGTKLGINVASPNFKLDIMTTDGTADGIQLLNGGTGKWVRLMSQNLGTLSYNNITVAGDAGIIFGSTAGINTVDYGFVIAPHLGAKSGLRISKEGNVAVGAALDVTGNVAVPLNSGFGYGFSDKFTYDSKAVGNYSLGWVLDTGNADAAMAYLSSYGGIKLFTAAQPRFTITKFGNVGIGTVSPDAKLTVNGGIHATEVKVDLSVPAPDYVFEADYKLPTLLELQAYLKVNKHLPEVPPAKEMEANGVELKAMNMILLKKVEELTLYLIEQQEQIKKQGEMIQRQGEAIKTLERRGK